MMEFALAVTTGEWKETEYKHKFQHFLSHYLGDITTKSDKLIGHDKVQSILNRLTTRIKESEELNLGTWIHKPRD